MIATTINIHKDILSKISCAAAVSRTSRKKVIVMLLMRIMEDNRFYTRSFSTVHYQQDDAKDNWHCFHVRFREDENEFFVDLRKFCKCSVSCLLAIAVKRYIDELLMDVKKGVDNYTLFWNYVLHHDVVNGIISWRIYWGYPGDHLKTLRL